MKHLIIILLVMVLLVPSTAEAYAAYNVTSSTASTTVGGSQDHGFNFNISSSSTIDQLHLSLSTLDNGGVWRFLIYADNAGEPGAIIDQSYNVSMGKAELNETALNKISFPTGITLSSGTYWVVIAAEPFTGGTLRYFRDGGDPLSYSGIQYTLSKPYSWVVWGGGANDATGAVEATIIIPPANTPPDNVNDSDWITPNVNPFTHNGTSFLFNWTASNDTETAILTYRFIVNDTVIATVNGTNYTHTFGGEGKYHYLVNVSESDNLTRWVEGVTRNFSVDVSLPGVTVHSPNPDNSTIFTDATRIITNATYTDNLEVFAYNRSIWTAEYLATSFSLDTGTFITGSVTSFYSDDNDTFEYDEVTGSPGWTLHVNFTGVTALRKLHFIGLYDGSPAHTANLEVRNKTSSSWDILTEIPSNNSVTNIEIDLDDVHHLDSGLVRIRFNHPASGNANNMVAISKMSLHATQGITPLLHTEALNLNVTSITVNHTFSLAGQPDGEYLQQDVVVDSHTSFIVGDVDVDKNDEERRITFQRGDAVTIQHVSSLEIDDKNNILRSLTYAFTTWEYEHLGSKVSFSQKGTVNDQGLFRHEYRVSSSEYLYTQEGSSYQGHIVSGLYSWVDFEHEGLINVTMEYSGRDVIVTVTSTEANPSYQSIGGLNRKTIFTHFTLATTGPAVFNLKDMDGLSYVPDRVYLFNVTISDAHGISDVTLELNASNVTMNNIVGDVFQGNFSPLGAGVRQWRVYANDTLGLVTVSGFENHTISKATGISNLSINVTFPVDNGTAVFINCSSPNAEQNMTLYLDGTINGSSADFNEISVEFSIVCNSSETGNYTSSTSSASVSLEFPGVIPGFLQPGSCPDDTTTEVLMFGLLFLMLMTFFIVNQLIIKLPIIDVLSGLAMIFFAMALLGCNTALGGLAIAFGVAMMIFGFLK